MGVPVRTFSVEWTTSSLQELIADLRHRQGDANDVEVKSAAGGSPALGATICAFANMPEGGTIILGLDEAAGFTPVGLTDLAGMTKWSKPVSYTHLDVYKRQA